MVFPSTLLQTNMIIGKFFEKHGKTDFERKCRKQKISLIYFFLKKKLLRILLWYKIIIKEHLIIGSKTDETSSLYIKLELQSYVGTSILINLPREMLEYQKHQELLQRFLTFSLFFNRQGPIIINS